MNGFTLGTVVDTNDPQQMGRLKVLCPAFGDTEETQLSNIPWASYITPFGGTSPCIHRGPNLDYSKGPLSYGMFAIPKVGARALVACLDGNPEYRFWIGCLYGPLLTHTIPIGRYLNNTSGPVTSTENPVEPLATNMSDALGAPSAPEYRTRGPEQQVSSVSRESLSYIISGQPDKRNGLNDREGYQQTRGRDDLAFAKTEGNFDPQSYCITTPGLHMFVMDDSVANGRVRLRTTAGHQVILDDTNERIYISTAQGHNWIEMDQNGNIDIYAERRLSVHAIKDINFKTEGAFRVEAGGGIHLNQLGSAYDIRMTSVGSIHTKSGQKTSIQSGTDVNIKTGTTWKVEVGSNLQIKTNGTFRVNSTGTFCMYSSSTMHFDATTIDLNSGGNCAQAISPLIGSYSAFTVNRVPQHEPWGRIMSAQSATDNNYENLFEYNISTILELSYTSPNVGRVELGETVLPERNDNWRR